MKLVQIEKKMVPTKQMDIFVVLLTGVAVSSGLGQILDIYSDIVITSVIYFASI